MKKVLAYLAVGMVVALLATFLFIRFGQAEEQSQVPDWTKWECSKTFSDSTERAAVYYCNIDPETQLRNAKIMIEGNDKPIAIIFYSQHPYHVHLALKADNSWIIVGSGEYWEVSMKNNAIDILITDNYGSPGKTVNITIPIPEK